MSRILYPRGGGSSEGPVPFEYVEVHRWVDLNEVRLWMENQGTTIPSGVGAGGRVYVTLPGAPKPGGTGPCRVEFFFPQRGLNIAGDPLHRQIFQPVSSTPIYNVKIHVP
jgi:filamentous hemagglutinin